MDVLNINYGIWRNNMGNTLADIRKRLAEAEKNNNQQFDNSNFPFWNAPNGSTTEVRFVPDGDPTNTFFWVEKLQIKLPFNGIKNGESKPVYVNVPCVEMFGKLEYPQGCPILSEVRGWYKEKDPTSTELANKYWKKPTYIMQGFVRVNSVPDDSAPENPIRKFSFNKQLFNIIKAGLMDKDMENIPTDYSNGSDFKILKTTKGQYADYGTSSYSRKETSLTPIELAAIETYKLNNLSDYLGKHPTAADLEVIKEMFEASVNGEAYDEEKWGKFYRPANFKAANETDAATTSQETNSQPASVQSTPVETEKPSAPATTGKNNAADILAMIRKKKAEQQQGN